MFTFLAPAALAGIVLLAIPIIVHLFKPRKVRQTPFSSLRWLHLSQQKLARRIKWHQVLLFLLRAAFVILLVLALAKPMFSPKGEREFTERFVVIDVSRSMGYQTPEGGRPSPIELAKEAAAKIVGQSVPGDRTAVLFTGATTRSLGPLSRDADVYLAGIKSAQATSSDTDLASALQVIRPMLARRRAGTNVEIFFVTDNHQGAWRQSGIAAFTKDLGVPAKVQVVDVGVTGAQNAWVAGARLLETTRPQRRLVRVQVGCVGDQAQDRTVRLGGVPGLPELTQVAKVQPGNLSTVEIDLPPTLDLRGQVARITIEPGDGLPSDDVYHLNLDARAAVKVLLVEADTTQVEPLMPGFYLRTALGALSSSESRSVETVSRHPADASAEDISTADVVILADVPDLSDAQVAALEARVKAGGGLAIFLGPDVLPAFYNNKLYKPALPSESLLPAPLKTIVTPQGGLAPLTAVQWSHPLLSALYDPVLGDLAQVKFKSYYQLESAPENSQTLAFVGESAPAIVERPLGTGKVVFFNTTANDLWSDLPRRKSFVPLIDRMLTYLSGSSLRRSFEVGDTVALPVAGAKPGGSVTVVTPSGAKVNPELRSEAGRTVLRMEGVQEPGVYRVEGDPTDPKSGFAFVVQAGRGDSLLTGTDNAALKKWWEPLAMEVTNSDAALRGLAGASRRFALWPWLVAVGSLLLLAEFFFVHWLCPRMNPGVSTPVVPQTGIFSIKTAQAQAERRERAAEEVGV